MNNNKIKSGVSCPMPVNRHAFRIWRLLFLSTFFFSCQKGEPLQGPPGPEGPAGQDGADGSGGNGAAIAYQTPVGTTFRWLGNDKQFYLVPKFPSGIEQVEGILIRDSAKTLANALALVYMRSTRTAGDTAWIALPYTIRSVSNSNETDSYKYSLGYYNYDNDIAPYADISLFVDAEIYQNMAGSLTPDYKVQALRIIFIPVTDSGRLQRIPAFDTSQKGLSMEEVMKKYGLKESDYRGIE